VEHILPAGTRSGPVPRSRFPRHDDPARRRGNRLGHDDMTTTTRYVKILGAAAATAAGAMSG
jgi:hypothetical protein